MLAKTPIGQRFYRWVAAQPPEQRYNYEQCDHCACARFLIEELGQTSREVVRAYQCRMFRLHYPVRPPHENDVCAEVWDRFDGLAAAGRGWLAPSPSQWTFGKLARRIEQKMPECVV